MKAFLKYFLASFLALFFSLLFFLIIVFSIISSIGKTSTKKNIHNNSVLVIDLSNSIHENENTNAKSFLKALNTKDSRPLSIYEATKAIQTAKKDDKIKGIVLYYSNTNVSLSNLEELRTELEHFKKHNKFIYAFGDKLNMKNLYIASVANQIYLNPVSFIIWKGLGSKLLFFKNALEKLEIEMQIFYQGKFKSATEPFRKESMSQESKLQMHEIVSYIYQYMLETICIGRNIPYTTLNNITANLKIASAQDALRAKLVDQCQTENQFQQAIKKQLNLKEDEDIQKVLLSEYIENIQSKNNTNAKDAKIAIIYAEGEIVDNNEINNNQIQEKKYLKLLRKIKKDKTIKGVVLRINSPGGDAKASDKICHAIKQLKISKPVIVSMSSIAASGGYYIASHADSIFADRTTITGSIGIFAIIPNIQKFLQNKLGITNDGVESVPNSNFDILSPLSESQKLLIERIIINGYNNFKMQVATGRKMELDIVEDVAQGRVWHAKAAQQNYLIDKIGGLQSAIKTVKNMAKIDKYTVEEFPKSPNLFEALLQILSNTLSSQPFEKQIGGKNTHEIIHHLNTLNNFNNGIIQTRLPYNYSID